MSDPGAPPPTPPLPEPAGYDPELPILAELESAYRRELTTQLRPAARRRRGPHRELAPGRITRRALLLVGLVSLVGASALAGSGVLGGAGRGAGRRSAARGSGAGSGSGAGPVLLSSGDAGGEHWLLHAYTRGASTCYAMFIAETAASSCAAPPGGAGVRVTSALGAEHRLLAGLTGPGAARALVRVGARAEIVPTHPLPRAATATAARLPAGVRWFVAVFPGESSLHAAPAHVTPLGAAGRPTGPTALDCSLGANNPACERAAASIAGD